MAKTEPKGYWVGDTFVQTETKQETGLQLKEKAGIEANRQLIAIAPDGTWKLIDNNEVVTPQTYERYDDVPSFIYG